MNIFIASSNDSVRYNYIKRQNLRTHCDTPALPVSGARYTKDKSWNSACYFNKSCSYRLDQKGQSAIGKNDSFFKKDVIRNFDERTRSYFNQSSWYLHITWLWLDFQTSRKMMTWTCPCFSRNHCFWWDFKHISKIPAWLKQVQFFERHSHPNVLKMLKLRRIMSARVGKNHA